MHNSHGGYYGWSGPLTLTVNDGTPWTTQQFNVKNYGAKGDGVTDDEAAINAAMLLRFVNVNISAKGYNIADFSGSTRVSFENCALTGGGNGVFFGNANQVFIDHCQVYGTNDANTLLTCNPATLPSGKYSGTITLTAPISPASAR